MSSKSQNNFVDSSKVVMGAIGVPTCIGCWRFVVDPLDDLEAVLGGDDGDAGDAGDEVLQGNSSLHHLLLTQLERAELCRIALWETESKSSYY